MKEVENNLVTYEDKILRADDTFKAQKSISDKLWFNLAYHAKSNAVSDAKSDNITVKYYGDIEQEYNRAEEDKKNEYASSMLTDARSVERVFRELSVIKGRILTALGQEAQKVSKKIGDIPDKELVADITVKQGGSSAKMLLEGADELQSRLLYQTKQKSDMMFEHLGITSETNLKKLFDTLKLSDEQKREFLIEHECTENDNIYDAFDVTPTEDEYVGEEYVEEVVDNYVQNEANRLFKDFIREHGANPDVLADLSPETNATGVLFFSMVNLSEEAKQEFYTKYNCEIKYKK